MRNWRKSHPLTPAQRFKDTARSYAGVYKRRGRIVPEPCRVCGKPAEMHHPDYDKPVMVWWFCREHHLQHHKGTVMEKVSVTYKAPEGDSKVIEVFGHTFFDGKAENIEVDERTLAKLKGNKLFDLGAHSEKHDPPEKGKKEHA
jgi:hypothetical protein